MPSDRQDEPLPATRCEPFLSSASEWDALAARSADRNVFQSSGWGEYRRLAAWVPSRWVARDRAGEVVLAVQILTRSLPGRVRVGWAPGGPLVRFGWPSPHTVSLALRALVTALAGSGERWYVRFDSYVPNESELAFAFNAMCTKPPAPINTGFTMLLDLRPPLERVLESMTAKHRYYLKRALLHDVRWDARTDDAALAELAVVHRGMVRRKRLGPLHTLDAADLGALRRALGDAATVFSGRVGDAVVASCLVLDFAGKAFYFNAATAERGREIGASYALLYRLIEHLKARGIEELDLGGLDPRSPAEGVNHFKGGFGGTLVQRLGEWEWASHAPLAWAVNLYVPWRGRTRGAAG